MQESNTYAVRMRQRELVAELKRAREDLKRPIRIGADVFLQISSGIIDLKDFPSGRFWDQASGRFRDVFWDILG